MSDPFSVAGTAVGIASLGIQTCQILIRYYSQFRGIHQDIDDVLKRVGNLECILKRLVTVNTKLSSYESSSNLESALNSCAQASQRLKHLVDKVGTGLEGKSQQNRLLAAKSRVMWPFKKETLADLKSNLSDFQDNLALALQISGLDVALQTADQLTSTKNHIDGVTTRIESELRSQSDVMISVREGFKGFSDAQREQASIVSQEIANLQARLLAHEESIEQKFHFLISQTTIGIKNRPVPLSLLADTAQAASDAQHHFRRGLENYDTLTRNSLDLEPQVSSAHRGACTCRAKQKSAFKTYRWKILLSQNTYKHRTDCPQHSPQDFSRTIVAQITICNRIMQYCVLVGWKQSKHAGWSSSAPVFRYRPVVPSGTGVFQATEKAMHYYALHYGIHRNGPFESTISVFMDHVRQCYSEGLGSPFDIDEFGHSILIEAMKLLKLLVMRGLRDFGLISSVLDPHLEYGILHNQDKHGCTPIMFWQCTMASLNQTPARAVLQYLIRRVDSWIIAEILNIHLRKQQDFYDTVSVVLKSEEALNCFEYGDLMSLAVLRRCDADFCRYLASNSPQKISENLTSLSCRNSLASWPAGLEIFLRSGSAAKSEEYIVGLFDDSLHLQNTGSIETLLEHGFVPTYGDWMTFLAIIDEERTEREVDGRRRIREKDRERQREGEERFKTISQLMAQNLPRIRKHSELYSLYWCGTLCVTTAQALWSAGHRSQSSDTSDFLSDILWNSISKYQRPWSSVWPIFCWLVDHGADVTWVEPVFLTTSAHVITRIAKLSLLRNYAKPKLGRRILNLIASPCRDCCTCYCSEGGCTILGCSLSRYTDIEPGYSTTIWFEELVRRLFLRAVDRNQHQRWISSAALRVLTFEELSLTHTCCYRILEETGWWSQLSHDRFERPSSEEAQDIYHTEREGIALLEALLPEFEGAWKNYEGSFVKFIDAVWKPRMKKVQKELRKSMKSPAEILRNTGVCLKNASGEYVSEFEEDTDTETDNDSRKDSDSEGSENSVQTEDEDEDTDDDNDDNGYITAAED